MKRIAATALAFALISAAPAQPAAEPPAPAAPPACERWDGINDYLDIDPRPARQGSSLRITPMQQHGPAHHVTPIHCTSDWAVSDPALAMLSEDRRSLRIAEDARPGATVAISYAAGGRRVSGSVTIVGRTEFVLTGRRVQRSAEGCEGLKPVGELEFSSEGRFSVTWQPFETYKDYWGTYRLDPNTGTLLMVVVGGNDIPGPLDLEGKASIAADGALVLEHMFLGQPSWNPALSDSAPACRYTFG
jgi:hypothetical protein